MPRTKKMASSDLLLEVAKLRFESGLSNQEIARRLGIGTKQVASLLESAVTWLIAEHRRLARIESGEPAQQVLEQSLRRKYAFLKNVTVIPAGKIETEEQYSDLIHRWAVQAANYFEALIASEDFRDENNILNVSISGGEVHLEVMNSLDNHARPSVKFYASAFLGRGMLGSFHIDPATNATIGWTRSGRIPGHCVYGTLSPNDLDIRRTEPFNKRKEAVIENLKLLADSEPVQTITEQLDKVTVAFAGLGMVVRPKGALRMREPTASRLLQESGIDPRELAADGAVGDLSYGFFDANGNESKDWRFFLSAGHYSKHKGVEFYRRMVNEGKPVIFIGGPFKLPAIIAALKGRLFNVWFTDDETARKVLAAG